jgi:hypothetical protein
MHTLTNNDDIFSCNTRSCEKERRRRRVADEKSENKGHLDVGLIFSVIVCKTIIRGLL